jgi:hypothetical protein
LPSDVFGAAQASILARPRKRAHAKQAAIAKAMGIWVLGLVATKGEPCNFSVQMYLDDEPPIAGGREIWGFPKKYGIPMKVIKDTTALRR